MDEWLKMLDLPEGITSVVTVWEVLIGEEQPVLPSFPPYVPPTVVPPCRRSTPDDCCPTPGQGSGGGYGIAGGGRPLGGRRPWSGGGLPGGSSGFRTSRLER